MTRRGLLTRVAAAGGAAALNAFAAERSQLLTETYIWLELLQRQKRPVAEALDEIFSQARQAGFRRLEMNDFFVGDDLRARTLELLRRNDMQAPIVYHGGNLWDRDAAEKTLAGTSALADHLLEVNAAAMNFNPDPKPGRARKTDNELRLQADYLNRLGALLAKKGLRLFVHNHDAEMSESAREWRSNLRHTDPALVWFCIDVHWVFRGGQDPMALLQEAGRRVASLHLRNSRDKVWMQELGPGDVDYGAVARWLEQQDIHPYLVVELAYDPDTPVTRSLVEDLTISREFAQRTFRKLLA